MISPRSLRAAAFLLAGLLLWLAGCNRVPPSAQDPESAADAFFADLEQRDARAAYDSAAFGFQAAQSFDAFVSNARDLGLVGGGRPVWTEKKVEGTQAQLAGTIKTASGPPLTLSITMTSEGKAWKLFSLQTSSSDQGPENRFTLVGKGTGFNDVYHQPMPSAPQLDELVQKTLADFNAAIQMRDFHDFYQTLSQQWKNAQRFTGDEAADVTPGMLMNHFQPFIAQKIDLSSIAGLKPVYTQTPQINKDGLLELVGYIPGPRYRVNFQLDYAYELPWWKLFGINVDLTK